MPKPLNSIFPNVGVAGYYRQYSQTVHVACTTMDQAATFAGRPLLEAREFLTTVNHELTHWLDHHATLCGQEYLIGIYNADHALSQQSSGAENEYWRGMALRDFERRHHRGEYYSLLGPSNLGYVSGFPWAFESRCGIEFDYSGRPDHDHPIFMAAFVDPASGGLIARQAISATALWETCAVWSEIATEREILAASGGEDAAVTQRLWMRDHINRAYAKELTIYSAPAHLLSIRIGTQDIALSYWFAATAANYCLNLPKDQFENIQDPASFAPFGQRRLNGFKAHADRGYLFAVLASNGPTYVEGMTAQQWVNAAARASGLPDIARLSSLTVAAMNELEGTLSDVHNKRYVLSALEAGRHSFLRRLTKDDPAITPTRLVEGLFALPPAIFDDGGIYATSPPKSLIALTEETLEVMVGFGLNLEKLMQNFQGACR